MRYTPYISKNATADIMNTKLYYDAKGDGLGVKFGFGLEGIIDRICTHPKAFSIRYKDIRAAKIQSLPYLVFYRINLAEQAIQILRVFNTHQKPFWK